LVFRFGAARHAGSFKIRLKVSSSQSSTVHQSIFRTAPPMMRAVSS
jgi:hypothetical protein